MKYTKLNNNWAPHPNTPEPVVTIDGWNVKIDFYLNDIIFGQFTEDQRGLLLFTKVHKFSFNPMNDEGYYMGKYRYKYTELPWGEFYQLDTDWKTDFHPHNLVVLPLINAAPLKHYILFLRDNTFECVAENYAFTISEPA